jgi:3-phenylpropionate/trans-cinnamate dioxygenase ferredoxin reductase subunit
LPDVVVSSAAVREAVPVSDERTFVIVGASLAGAKAAETLRKEGFEGRVILVGAENHRPYERPPLSKGQLLGKAREKAFLHDAEWYADQNIELVLGVRATALDPQAHTVTLDDVEPMRYDKLLLATGSVVRELDLPGSESSGIRYLRTIEDADAILADLREGTNVVVIGAGWIGLETAAAARSHGATVHVVETEILPLRRVLGDELATVFADLHRAHGVQFHFDIGVREFGDLGGRLTHVVLSDGTEIPADLAIVGVGIRPATELAASAGLSLDNGVVVDANLQTSAPDVYACGDVASWPSTLVGRHIRVEHWENAKEGGKAAARAMLGQDAPYSDHVPYFFSDQYDLGMEYCGYVAPGEYDQVVVRGEKSIVDGKAPEFIAFWLKGSRVLAAMNVNIWDVQDDLVKLVRAGYAGTAVDAGRLADTKVPLGDVLG